MIILGWIGSCLHVKIAMIFLPFDGLPDLIYLWMINCIRIEQNKAENVRVITYISCVGLCLEI